LPVNVENLLLSGTGNINGLGTAANNIITGNAGNNIINGGLGADTMTGGAGNDVYYVDNAGDKVVEAANGGTDSVYSTISYSLPANVENLALLGTGNINGTGNTLANSIRGTTGNNVITGGGAGDTLIGDGGSDQFVYNAIADSQPGAGKFDRISDFTAGSGTGADKIDFTAVTGVTTIQGLIHPTTPSETPPATGLNAHSIAWYQDGTETVVIANANGTAGHVDMELVLNGVTASTLSTVAGVNFIPDPPAAPSPHAAAMDLLTQQVAGFGASPSVSATSSSAVLSGTGNDATLLAPSHHG
jgi:Ca2+-binding RTX toxin-like protein